MKTVTRIKLACLCGLSLISALVILTFTAGAKRVPWAPDSQGRLFSFNQTMSPEHYQMAFQNVTWERIRNEVGFPEMVCFAAPVIGMGLLIAFRQPSHPLIAGYFLVQAGAIPCGLLGIPILLMILSSGVDGECLTDGPMMSWSIQGLWLATATTVGIVLTKIRRRLISAQI